MLRMCLVMALFGGFTAAPHASASLLSRHYDVWDNEWQDAAVEWESLLGRLLTAIQTRKLQEAHDLIEPMTGVIARINTLAQPAVRRNESAGIRAVAAILVEGSRETLLQYRFQERSDLDMLTVYLTQLANNTHYHALKKAGGPRVRHKRWQAGGINAGIFSGGLALGSGSMATLFMALHTHMYSSAGPISVTVGALLGAGLVKGVGAVMPRGPRYGDKNVVKGRLLDCRRMLELY